jgi:hypothetical protein
MIPRDEGCDSDPNRSETNSPSKLLFYKNREDALFPSYKNRCTLNTKQGAMIPFSKFFDKGKV